MSDTPFPEVWRESPGAEIAALRAQIATLTAQRDGLQVERDAANTLARQYMNQVGNLTAEVERKQAQIDALMLEYCPDEMTPEQMAEWVKHQQPAGESR